MTLEQQVCSLDLAKRLKEIGVPQNSLFYWWKTDFKDEWDVFFHEELPDDPNNPIEPERFMSAYLASELGEMLPWTFNEDSDDEMFLGLAKMDYGFACWYEGTDKKGHEFKWKSHIDESEADARAKILIYLLENKLVTL